MQLKRMLAEMIQIVINSVFITQDKGCIVHQYFLPSSWTYWSYWSIRPKCCIGAMPDRYDTINLPLMDTIIFTRNLSRQCSAKADEGLVNFGWLD